MNGRLYSHPGAIRRVEVRFFFPGNKRSKLHVAQASPRCAFTPDQVEEILENFIEQIDKEIPTEDFELVSIGPGKYNCVHRGARKAAEPEIESFSKPETSAEIKQRIMERLDREERSA
jgi:hypothetical protein